MSSVSGSIYLCVKQFNARLGDELNLKIGDKVEVLADDSEYNDGWYMGRNLLTNDVGLYPKTFTQLLHTPKNPENTLLRSRSRRVASSTSINKLAENVSSLSLNAPPTPPQKDTYFQGDSKNESTSSFNNSYNNLTNGSSSNILKSNEKSSNGSDSTTTKPVVHRTMSEIDMALKELQDRSSPPKPGEGRNDKVQHEQHHVPPTPPQKQPLHPQHRRENSTQSLTEDLDPTEAATWTPKQVSSYFAIVLGFDLEIAGKFARHKITGTILFELDLTHLKELDIDSFGTRFEVYKEIEKLKLASKSGTNHNSNETTKLELPDKSFPYKKKDELEEESNNGRARPHSQLMPPAAVTGGNDRPTRENSSYNKSHQRQRSQSLENISSQFDVRTPKADKRRSVVITPQQSFLSPRKAPEPPSHQSPLNKSFKFGAHENSPDVSSGNIYNTRNNAPNTGLGISTNGLSRPASSIYDNSINSHNRKESGSSQTRHRRNSSVASGHHRRHSSLFLFLSTGEDLTINGDKTPKAQKTTSDDYFRQKGVNGALTSPANIKSESRKKLGFETLEEPIDIDKATLSPKKLKSVSYRTAEDTKSPRPLSKEGEDKRSVSDSNAISRLKTLRTSSTQNFRSLTSLKKLKTSAFQEGIRQITPDEAIKSANFSGWMSKKSGSNIGWRSRYFTLHGTRLLYFTSLRDKRERGLIDITAHKVLPINTDDSTNNNDKYIAMYASSTGFGRYCFKIVPPAPGFKKGLTFTQPKTHYFAVETQEDMRGWLKALMTATIDIDDTVPVVSSCATPTVTLSKAQEMLARAREETKLKDEELRAQGYFRDGFDHDYANMSTNTGDTTVTTYDPAATSRTSLNNLLYEQHDYTSEENSPLVDLLERLPSLKSNPKLSLDTTSRSASTGGHSSRTPTTPLQGGFASPYLLASGLLSPKSGNGNHSTTSVPQSSSRTNSPSVTTTGLDTGVEAGAGSGSATPLTSKYEYFPIVETTPKLIFSNSNGRIVSGGSSLARKKSDKMMAYSNDGSGNHSFVIKQKSNK